MYRSGRSVIAPFFWGNQKGGELIAERYWGDSVKTVGATIRFAPDGGLWADHWLGLE
ncbi:hypothetical protein BN1864_LIB5394:06309 [Pseudomonas sp. 1 R 17]|nr:hypothetical protein BN1864_LIB5394:06309 [Pseudomonas sp. 1 R 17]